jgi:protein-S-isoprenylcysteine O-methyltransferase Ste14
MMDKNTKNSPIKFEPSVLLRAVIGLISFTLMPPAFLFIAAGTLHWPMAWVYVVFMILTMAVSRILTLQKNPDLLRERARFSQRDKSNAKDHLLVAIIAVYGPLAASIITGLDYRLGWTNWVSFAGQLAGVAALLAGYAFGVWAMVSNPFFSANARIQKDRGQIAVSTGPYHIVRHPAYLGGIISAVAFPVMMDALWALLPALVMVVAIIIRTGLEDDMLIEGLDGYSEYSQKVRFRLLPGVW